MSTTSTNICKNCDTKSESPFKFCPNCGQKNTDGKITFSELWSEFKDAALNINSRTWQTVKHIFIPGKLTLAYFSGKHQRYVHPLRLLLISSLLLIISMSFQDFQSATNHGYDVKERILKNYERKQLFRMLGNITDSTKANFPTPQTEIITDTIMSSFRDSLIYLLAQYENKYGDKYRDSVDLNKYLNFGTYYPEKIAKSDFLSKDEEELLAMYKNNAGHFERLVFKQKVKHIQDESKLTAAIIGHTTWATLLLMPCLALVLYLLYIRHSYYYIEHLIFTFHLHAFSFLLLAIWIAVLYIFPWWIFFLFLISIWIYVFLSMRRVYQQRVGKTLFKFVVLGIAYSVLFILFLVGTVIFTFFLL